MMTMIGTPFVMHPDHCHIVRLRVLSLVALVALGIPFTAVGGGPGKGSVFVLRSFQADGKVYAIDRNGIIFGGPHQVNTGALAAAAMDATSNSQTKLDQEKRAKPVHTSVSSIVITEIVGYGK
jgi:hypothetical protein